VTLTSLSSKTGELTGQKFIAFLLCSKECTEAGVVAHTCNPSTQEIEAGESGV
jgi:hypothetical protein